MNQEGRSFLCRAYSSSIYEERKVVNLKNTPPVYEGDKSTQRTAWRWG